MLENKNHRRCSNFSPLRDKSMKDLIYLFRWQDGLEILLLTFVFYRLYLRLRKKRALRMVLAILALPVFYLIARWIDLPLSVWGLQNLWAVILLVLVVLFQQEIREVLGSLTFPSFFLGRQEVITSEALNRVADGAFRMTEKGMGGLIVLQRKDDLDEFIHGQTPLDSEISEAILLSIFNPQSPLHDGAVILQGDRIRYATALLPVSQSLSVPREWGTRHRSGLGITEVSDAESIIISEERKNILYARRGKVEKIGKKEDLTRSLGDLPPLLDEKNRKQRWMSTLSHDLPIKTLFFGIVLLLWVFVIGIHQGEISFSIPIEYYSAPVDLGIAGDPPKEINVRLKGSQRLLSSTNPEQVRVQINLSKAHQGMNQIQLCEADILTPSGINVTYFYPRSVRIYLSPVSNSIKK